MSKVAISTNQLPIAVPNSGRHIALTQMNSITILDQAYLDASSIGTELALQIKFYQYQMNSASIKYSNDVVRKFINLMALCSNYCNIINSYIEVEAPIITNSLYDPSDKKDIENATQVLIDLSNEVAYGVNLLKIELTLIRSTFNEIETEYKKFLGQLISSGGEKVKNLYAEIDALNETIKENIKTIIEGGNDLAQGISDLGNSVLTTLKNIPSEKKEKKEKSLLILTDEEPDPNFSIESIGLSAKGVAKGSKATKELARNNKKMAMLYQELKTEEALISVATAILTQNKMFIDSFAKCEIDTGELEKDWKKIESDCQDLLTKIQDLSTEEEARKLRNEIELSSREWKNLNNQIKQVKKALTGS